MDDPCLCPRRGGRHPSAHPGRRESLFGTGDLSTAAFVSAGWVLNLAVGEWVIRRSSTGRTDPIASGERHGIPPLWAGEPTVTRAMGPTTPANYEIRLAGHLDRHWSDWFDGLTLILEADGTTTLQGSVADQAALHGLLAKVRDLGTFLISVRARESVAESGSQ